MAGAMAAQNKLQYPSGVLPLQLRLFQSVVSIRVYHIARQVPVFARMYSQFSFVAAAVFIALPLFILPKCAPPCLSSLTKIDFLRAKPIAFHIRACYDCISEIQLDCYRLCGLDQLRRDLLETGMVFDGAGYFFALAV